MCIYPSCKTIPVYNIEGETKGLYCVTHKLEGMVNVKDKSCIYPNCKTRPNYNIEKETKALYCATHKLEGMINIKNKTCIHPNCKTRPNYNIEGEMKPLYCATHKLEGMINVKSKSCIYPNCKTIPVYNVEGEFKPLYCATHKLEGMINVISKRCIHSNCKVIPLYNIEGETKALYCATHKKDEMVNVKDKSCIYPNCKTRPNYNIEKETKALYCATHKLEGMINVKNKTCKNEWCYTRVKEKYDGYCLYCYINMFPDKPVSRNYKTKEYAVVEYVKNKFSNFDWKTDKIINGGCSKRRPDLLLDLGYQIIIVEVDENQHIDYDCSCENKRIMELSLDLGHRPIIFIRFNPDEYETNGENISSCWGINKKGICVVKKRKTEEWNQRLNVLEEHINYWTIQENKTNKIVEVIQLFYDS
jgi:hypothetical protein